MYEQLANGSGEVFADVRHLFQPFQPLLPKELVHWRLRQPNGRRGAEICGNSKGIGALIPQELSSFLQPTGDLLVDSLHSIDSSSKMRSHSCAIVTFLTAAANRRSC
jgi:hypothetical protein